MKLLLDLGHGFPVASPTFPAAWALASKVWGIGAQDSLMAWLVVTLEGQLAVLQKAVPIGQVAAQRLFSALAPTLEAAHHLAMTLPDGALSSSLPGLATFSARHESQYSRLFRS
jgi:urease accessory protein